MPEQTGTGGNASRVHPNTNVPLSRHTDAPDIVERLRAEAGNVTRNRLDVLALLRQAAAEIERLREVERVYQSLPDEVDVRLRSGATPDPTSEKPE